MARANPMTEARPSLYERDFCLWVEEQVRLLRQGTLERLDVVNLVEEIADLGLGAKKAVKSNLVILLLHLLKHQFQTRRRSRSWHEFTATSFEVRSRSGMAFVGVDGEALEMKTPMEFRIFPRGLRLLVPEGNLEAAKRRRARNVSLRELLDVARG